MILNEITAVTNFFENYKFLLHACTLVWWSGRYSVDLGSIPLYSGHKPHKVFTHSLLLDFQYLRYIVKISWQVRFCVSG